MHVVFADFGTALTQLLQVHEDAGVTLGQAGIKAKVRTKDKVDGVVLQTVLAQTDRGAHAAKLMPEVASLVQKAQRVHIA